MTHTTQNMQGDSPDLLLTFFFLSVYGSHLKNMNYNTNDTLSQEFTVKNFKNYMYICIGYCH